MHLVVWWLPDGSHNAWGHDLLDTLALVLLKPNREGRTKILKGIMKAYGKGLNSGDLEKPPRRPGGRGGSNDPWVRVGPFWLEGGALEPVDTAVMDPETKQRK